MAKRFTDTNKYKKTFFRSLPGAYKLFWDFLYHECDNAGVWHVDFDIAQIYIGKDMIINPETAIRMFNENEERIKVLENGKKWFVVPFIPFQYGTLTQTNNMHKPIMATLLKLGLRTPSRGPSEAPTRGAMDKDMDKDKEDVKEGVPGEVGFGPKELMGLWNRKAHPTLARLRFLTDIRERHIKARLKHIPTEKEWNEIIEKINRSPLLTGQKGDWRASFDWVINQTNLVKIREGNYDA